jgi:hypothetical protein
LELIEPTRSVYGLMELLLTDGLTELNAPLGDVPAPPTPAVPPLEPDDVPVMPLGV